MPFVSSFCLFLVAANDVSADLADYADKASIASLTSSSCKAVVTSVPSSGVVVQGISKGMSGDSGAVSMSAGDNLLDLSLPNKQTMPQCVKQGGKGKTVHVVVHSGNNGEPNLVDAVALIKSCGFTSIDLLRQFSFHMSIFITCTTNLIVIYA